VSMVQLFDRVGGRVYGASGICGARARSVRIGSIGVFVEFQSDCACGCVVSVVMMLVSCLVVVVKVARADW
jgi:ABC-type sulfate transport system permease component